MLVWLEVGVDVKLYIEIYVCEDVFKFFGFLDEVECVWFVYF